MIHFDTNFLIAAFRAGSKESSQMHQWLGSNESVGISTVVWSEFLCGPLDAKDEILARAIFPSPESLLPSDAELAATFFNKTGRRSRSLADCMIAAIAVRCGARLATRNTSDFQSFIPFGLVLA